MDLYLVGGAVRDSLLGIPVHDRDFVVVGATVEEFLAKFPTATPIGSSFPVFLVPGIGEFAFARTEFKYGTGHTEFNTYFTPDITLEMDLERRDLTINTMAQKVVLDSSRVLMVKTDVIDPFGGQADLKIKLLRHTSKAFVEDPLRIFRVARFAAKFGWPVAVQTLALCETVSAEEIAALSQERIATEFLRALEQPFARRFIEVLEQTGVLAKVLPEVSCLRRVPAGSLKHHPEGDTLTHTLMVLDEAIKLGGNRLARVAALFHDLGKAATPEHQWPHHYGHEAAGVPIIKKVCERMKLPTDECRAACLAASEHLKVHRFLEMGHEKQYDLVVLANRNPLGVEGLALVAEADSRGRSVEVVQVDGCKALLVAGKAANALHFKGHDSLDHGHEIPEWVKGAQRGQYVRREKAKAIKAALAEAGLKKAPRPCGTCGMPGHKPQDHAGWNPAEEPNR